MKKEERDGFLSDLLKLRQQLLEKQPTPEPRLDSNNDSARQQGGIARTRADVPKGTGKMFDNNGYSSIWVFGIILFVCQTLLLFGAYFLYK